MLGHQTGVGLGGVAEVRGAGMGWGVVGPVVLAPHHSAPAELEQQASEAKRV